MGAVAAVFVSRRGGGHAGALCSRCEGVLNKGETPVVGDGTKGLDFQVTYGSNAGMEEAKDDMDPSRLGVDGAKQVGGGVDEVIEKATGGRHLDAF